MSQYRIDFIGPFGLFAPDGERINVSSKKAVALLALLAASPKGVRSRVWLQNILWESRGAEQAQASLRRELSTLVKQLAIQNADHLLERETQRIALKLDLIDIDILSLGITARPGPQFYGDFLEGINLRDCEEFEDWLRIERERVRDMLELVIPEPSRPQLTNADILGGATLDAHKMLNDQSPSLPPKPSVAVLPFEQYQTADVQCGGSDWLGSAMADEVALILSQYPQLFIVSSSSARSLVSGGVRKQDVAVQLGVRYLIDGSVVQLGSELRVAVMLLDGLTGEQIWGQAFDGDHRELQCIQSEIARSVAPQIWTKVDIAERNRGIRNSTLTAGNYEYYWRANAMFRTGARDDVIEAIRLARLGLEQDPTCSWTASLIAFCLGLAYLQNFVEDREVARREAIGHYQTALRYGGDNAEVLGYAVGTLVVIGGDMEVAERLVAHSLDLLPAHQPTLFWGGWVDIMAGNSARARERFELALRLNPASGVRSQTLCGIGFAALLEGNFDEAYLFLKDASNTSPPFILTPLGLCIAADIKGDEATVIACVAMLKHLNYEGLIGMFQDSEKRQLLKNAIGRHMTAQ